MTYTKRERDKLTQMAENIIVLLEKNKIHYDEQIVSIDKAKHLIMQRQKYKVKAEISKLKLKINKSEGILRGSILEELESDLRKKEAEYLILNTKNIVENK